MSGYDLVIIVIGVLGMFAAFSATGDSERRIDNLERELAELKRSRGEGVR